MLIFSSFIKISEQFPIFIRFLFIVALIGFSLVFLKKGMYDAHACAPYNLILGYELFKYIVYIIIADYVPVFTWFWATDMIILFVVWIRYMRARGILKGSLCFVFSIPTALLVYSLIYLVFTTWTIAVILIVLIVGGYIIHSIN